MPVFEIYVNDQLNTIGGGDNVDLLTFGILRASDADRLVAQLTGMDKASSTHTRWMYLPLAMHDTVKITYKQTGPVSRTQDIWQSPVGTKTVPLPSDEGPIGPMAQPRTNSTRIPGGSGPRLHLLFDDGRTVCASADRASNLQMTVTWSKVTQRCAVEVGSIRISDEEPSEMWLEAYLNLGEQLQVRFDSAEQLA